jgi:acyl-CoA thioesterase FadM
LARVRLELPKHFGFTTEIDVRIGDINYGNHMGNDAVLRLAHEARVRFLNHHGFSELDIGGRGLIIADALIVYKSQAFYGDVIETAVAAGDFSRHGCDIFYRMRHKGTGREIARVKTGIVFFDYANQKIARVPDVFSAAIVGETGAQGGLSSVGRQTGEGQPQR